VSGVGQGSKNSPRETSASRSSAPTGLGFSGVAFLANCWRSSLVAKRTGSFRISHSAAPWGQGKRTLELRKGQSNSRKPRKIRMGQLNRTGEPPPPGEPPPDGGGVSSRVATATMAATRLRMQSAARGQINQDGIIPHQEHLSRTTRFAHYMSN